MVSHRFVRAVVCYTSSLHLPSSDWAMSGEQTPATRHKGRTFAHAEWHARCWPVCQASAAGTRRERPPARTRISSAGAYPDDAASLIGRLTTNKESHKYVLFWTALTLTTNREKSIARRVDSMYTSGNQEGEARSRSKTQILGPGSLTTSTCNDVIR